MGRRSIINKYAVMSAADSTTSPSSTPTNISSVDFITYEIELSSGVVADLEVYVCNTDKFTLADAKMLDFGQSTPLVYAADAACIVHVKNMGFKWMFFKVVNNGGTGNVTGYVSGSVGGA